MNASQRRAFPRREKKRRPFGGGGARSKAEAAGAAGRA